MSNDGRPGGPLKVDPLGLLITAAVFFEILLFGSENPALAMPYVIGHLVLLLAVLAFSGGREPPLPRMGVAAILMAAVFALGVFSTLPVGPPLAHPFWSEVQAIAPRTAATISLDPVLTRIRLLQLAGMVALFLVGMTLGWDRDRAERFSSYLVFAGIAYCLWATVAWIVAPHLILGVPRTRALDRLTASLFSPNTAATLFASLAMLGVMGFVRPLLRQRDLGERVRLKEFGRGWPHLVLLALALPCLFLTQSRGGLMAFAAALLLSLSIVAWIKTSRGSLTGGLLAVVFAVLFLSVAAFLVGGQSTADRLQTVDPLNNDRLQIFAAYWPTVLRSPWFGYGMGAFRSYTAFSMTGTNWPMLSGIGSVHNVYLEWLLQTGVTGAVCMFGAALAVILTTVRGVLRRSTQQALGIACIAVTAVFAVHGLTDFAIEVAGPRAFLAVIMGFGYGLAERPSSGAVTRRRRSKAPKAAAT